MTDYVQMIQSINKKLSLNTEIFIVHKRKNIRIMQGNNFVTLDFDTVKHINKEIDNAKIS
jgi:hypothetical protein